MKIRANPRTGMATKNISASCQEVMVAMTTAKIIMNGALTTVLTMAWIELVTLVQSVVSLVTSEAVENRSMLEKENVWML